MALFFADLVREASWGTGTGDLPLGGALPGHQRFADAVPPGARFHYCIAGVTHPDEWETGEGEIGSADTLIRLPLASSAGGAVVAFSPGLKTVALTVNAGWFSAREEGGAIDPVALAEALAAKADLAGAAFSGPISASALALDAPLAIAGGGTGAAGAGAARVNLGLVIGSDVQAQNARLADIAANLTATSGAVEKTGANGFGTFTVSSFGKSLIDDTDAAAARTTLGLGSAATASIGTSGAAVPRLNAANIWNGLQTFGAAAGLVNNAAFYAKTSGGSDVRILLPHASDTLYMGSIDAGFSTVVLRAAASDIATITSSGLTITGTVVGGTPGTFSPNPARVFYAMRASGNAAYLSAGQSGVEVWDIGMDASSPTLRFKASGTDMMTLSNSGTLNVGGIEVGYRVIPRVASSGGTATSPSVINGKCYATTGGITIPSTTYTAGDCFSIYNDTSGNLTITQGAGLTLRLGGTASTGNRTLAAHGFCTIWFNGTNEAIISGAGVS